MITISDVGKMDKSTVCRIIKRVSHAIARLAPQYIKFPSSEEDINKTKNTFFDVASFPNVIGAVDGTHIRIQSPGMYSVLTYTLLICFDDRFKAGLRSLGILGLVVNPALDRFLMIIFVLHLPIFL